MKTSVLVMAAILILFVLVGSVVLHLSGAMQGGSLEQEVLWEAPVSDGPPETLKAIDLTGDARTRSWSRPPRSSRSSRPPGRASWSRAILAPNRPWGT